MTVTMKKCKRCGKVLSIEKNDRPNDRHKQRVESHTYTCAIIAQTSAASEWKKINSEGKSKEYCMKCSIIRFFSKFSKNK